MTDAELTHLRASCTQALTHHIAATPHETFARLAAETPGDLPFDRYGAAEWLAGFEASVAAELGKEGAVFMPSGTMAQQIALRIWCDRAKCNAIAFHPTCHLELHESRGYAFLHGLRALTAGAPSRLMTAADIRAIADPLGAFLVELPQREIGAQLPSWDELVAQCDAARNTGAKLHLDGARLWEAAPFYDRTHAEIAALFDSVYVSFYKGLGAMAGAVLAGDEAFVAEARVWLHRHGGRLVTIAPLALSAESAFDRNLPKMRGYYERAIVLAAALARVPGIEIVPNPPHTNTFHVFIRGDKDALETRAHTYARETGTFVFARLAPTPAPLVQKWEFVVGEATDALSDAGIVEIVRAVVAPG